MPHARIVGTVILLAAALAGCGGVQTEEQIALKSTEPAILRVTPVPAAIAPAGIVRVTATTRNVTGPGYRILWHTTIGAISPEADAGGVTSSALFTCSQKGVALVTAELQLNGRTISSGSNTIKVESPAAAKPAKKFLFF